MLPHLSLLMLGDEVTIEVLQGHFGHGDPLLGVVTHGGARALASHCHALPGMTYTFNTSLQLETHVQSDGCHTAEEKHWTTGE